jgi:peptidoglycan hydrolase CwlO-like protein
MTMVAQTISLSIMLVAILAGIFLNNHALRELKADLKADIDRLDKKIDNLDSDMKVLQSDMRQFYHLSGKLEGRLDTLEKRVS